MPRSRHLLARFLLLACTLGASGARSEPKDAQSLPMPASLAPRVDFWARVYTEVGTDGGLIHDYDDLSLVYDVVRAPAGSSPASVSRRANEAKARYRSLLLRLASGGRTGLGPAERRVLALFPPDVSSKRLRAAAENLRFQLGQADKFEAGLRRMGRFEGYIRRTLRERGVPEDLVALPHVESSYDSAASSHAGAAGLWQFTRPTGRLYMRVDWIVDERRDPFASTDAAAKLLRNNYERLGSWPLAITAYNHGPGGMAKAVRQLGTRDIGAVVARYRSPSFGFASRNFYAEFLAARRIDQNPERWFGPIRKDPPVDAESVRLTRSYGAATLARALGLSLDVLREHNPALQKPVWSGAKYVPASYELRVPRRAGAAPAHTLIAAVPGEALRNEPVRRVVASAGAGEASGTHRVRPGDTLSEIAAEHGVSIDAVAAANGLTRRSVLRVGQVLEIPRARSVRAERAPEGAARASDRVARAFEPGPATSYLVRPGDTLIEIARRHGVSMARIAAANGVRDPRDLRAGQTLSIPGAPVPSATATAATAAPASETSAPGAASGSAPNPAAGAPIAEAEAPATPAPAGAPPSPATGDAPAAGTYLAPGHAEAGDAVAAVEPTAPSAAAPGRETQPASEPAAQPEGAPAREPAASSATAAAPAPDLSRREPREHRIEPGDTLGSIARRYGVRADVLAEHNGVTDPRRLRPGRVLEIPGDAQETITIAEAERSPAPREKPRASARYTVRPGDTLWGIAARHGVSASELAARNRLRDGRKLSIGQVLELPAER
jgi:membrane-bound lytic murein transglycosylase D